MMLDLKDERGATIIVPISLEYDMGRGYVANYVPSVYAQKNTETGKPRNIWFVNQISNGNLLYRNDKKSRQWASSSRLQLPWVGTHLNGKKIIFTDDDLVNLKKWNFAGSFYSLKS